MAPLWTAEIILQLRGMDISQKEFAEECGYSESYTSQVLRGRKNTLQARETMQAALKRLSKKRRSLSLQSGRGQAK